MTALDLTRSKRFGDKKTISVASARVKLADILGCGTDNITLFNLPPNSIIVDAYAIVDNAAQVGVTTSLGFSGGTELLAAVSVASIGVKQTALSIAALTLTEGTPNTLSAGTVTKGPKLLTGTGKVVTAKFSAEPNEEIDITYVVEFVEYTKANGDLMDVTRV